MSSICFSRCPQCNCNRLFCESSRRLNVVSCPICGYLDKAILLSAEQRDAFEREGWTVTKTTPDGTTIAIKKASGVGVVRLASQYGAETITLAEPITDEGAINTIKKIESDPTYDPNGCYITRWNQANECVEVLYGAICCKECRIDEDICEQCDCIAELHNWE